MTPEAAYNQARITQLMRIASLPVFVGMVLLFGPQVGKSMDVEVWMHLLLFAFGLLILGSLPYVERFSRRNLPGLTGEGRIRQLATSTQIIASIAEAPAVLGVVVSLISQSPIDVCVMGLISLIGLLRYYPQKEQWTT